MRKLQYGGAVAPQTLRPQNFGSTFVRVVRSAKEETGILILAVIALVVSTAVNLFVPFSVSIIIEASSVRDVGTRAGIVAAIFTVGAVATFFRVFLFGVAGERMIRRLKRAVFSHLLHLDVSYYDAAKTGELTNRLAVDAMLLKVASTFHFPMMLRFGLQIVGGVAVLLFLSWKLALVMCAPFPVLGILAVVYGKLIRRVSRSMQTALARNNEVAEESISNVRFVQLFGLEEKMKSDFSDRVTEAYKTGISLVWFMGAFQGAAEWASYMSVILVFWYGAILLIQGELTTAELTSFVLYAVMIAHAAGALSNQTGDFMRGLGGSERLFAILDERSRLDPEPDSAGPLVGSEMGHRGTDDGDGPGDGYDESHFRPFSNSAVKPVHGEIDFQHVSFAYPSRPTKSIFSDFSLSIHAGQVVALVGESGAGKSSIVHLISRLYDPISGGILLDGRNIRDMDLDWLRLQLGVVSQDCTLLSGTIAENIAFGTFASHLLSGTSQGDRRNGTAHRHGGNTISSIIGSDSSPSSTGGADERSDGSHGIQMDVEGQMERIIRAAKDANAHDFITALPNGYHTVVGGPSSLSGGQRQRIAIARVFLRNPAILLLDEATSALDVESERLVQEAIDRMIVGRTVVLIAHRLSTIRKAERVIVLKDGCVVEEGSQPELMAMENGVFRSMVEKYQADTAEGIVADVDALPSSASQPATEDGDHPLASTAPHLVVDVPETAFSSP